MFGNIMSRKRFEGLPCHITFNLPSDESDREGLIRQFIEAINRLRGAQVIPCKRICVDESMSRWYTLGGDWIDRGLPHYVAMDRKPENGCELKTSSCGESWILLRIKVFLRLKKWELGSSSWLISMERLSCFYWLSHGLTQTALSAQIHFFLCSCCWCNVWKRFEIFWSDQDFQKIYIPFSTCRTWK